MRFLDLLIFKKNPDNNFLNFAPNYYYQKLL